MALKLSKLTRNFYLLSNPYLTRVVVVRKKKLKRSDSCKVSSEWSKAYKKCLLKCGTVNMLSLPRFQLSNARLLTIINVRIVNVLNFFNSRLDVLVSAQI